VSISDAAKPGSIASFPVLLDMAALSVPPMRETWKMSVDDETGHNRSSIR